MNEEELEGEPREPTTEEEDDDLEGLMQAVQAETTAKGAVPHGSYFDELPVQLLQFIHDKTIEEIREAVREDGGTLVSKQIAFANLNDDDVAHFQSLIRQNHWLKWLSTRKRPRRTRDVVVDVEVEALARAQISKGHDGFERKLSVTQMIGTFRQAVAEAKSKKGFIPFKK